MNNFLFTLQWSLLHIHIWNVLNCLETLLLRPWTHTFLAPRLNLAVTDAFELFLFCQVSHEVWLLTRVSCSYWTEVFDEECDLPTFASDCVYDIRNHWSDAHEKKSSLCYLYNHKCFIMNQDVFLNLAVNSQSCSPTTILQGDDAVLRTDH